MEKHQGRVFISAQDIQAPRKLAGKGMVLEVDFGPCCSGGGEQVGFKAVFAPHWGGKECIPSTNMFGQKVSSTA